MAGRLLELSSQVDEKITNIAKKEKAAGTVKRLSFLHSQFADLVSELEEVHGLVAGGRAGGFTPQLKHPAKDVLPALNALIEDSKKGSVDTSQAQRVLNTVRSIANEARTEYAIHWRDYVVSRVPNLEGLEELVGVFTHVGGDQRAIANLRAAVSRLRALVNSAPTQEALSILDEVALQVPEALKTLVGEEPDVRSFAEAIASGGAAIHALTHPVLAWMKERGFEESFMIVPGRPAR